MKKSRRIVKKMSKKSLINKKALRYIIANSNLCKHAIRELELAGYSKEEDGPNKWMREQVIEAVALFSSHGNSGFSAPFEIKGRRRSVLMTPPVPEKVRVLSPAWYRAAVEFQGRPEQERLAFCSWCCCHGGCNLCMDISKYNIKGLKIYGG